MDILELKAQLKSEEDPKKRADLLAQLEVFKQNAEEQVRAEQKDVDFETKEFTVELLVNKYHSGLEDDTNELFVPDYQRDFVWSEKRQSRLIESLILGFPIPYIFTADVLSEDPELDGRIEIVDGSQRVRTIHAFIHNKLTLQDLKSLSSLNGFNFQDLPLSRQRRFMRIPVRVIELSSKCNEETRRDLFERINSGSDILKDMEVRKGSELGSTTLYTQVIKPCSAIPQFKELAPLSEAKEKRDERLEFTLRFFAYLDNYQKFDHSVREFLNDYMSANGNIDAAKQELMKTEFSNMLNFVEKYFPAGFRKTVTAKSTPRVRFESIAVGTALALRLDPHLAPKNLDWISSDKFKDLTTSDGANSRVKVIERIEYVRDQLLEG
ncbi:DUF262 domain-containing protein [Salmonella enterica subsp. enterica serovar Agama]|uniref:DUF262 domain-containing protein n=1 Tax=Salmonella enterica subsp. enterica serovar Agama TaxID=399581 RepID=A0A5I9ANN8_SALET|nr:DUF262 domain-containing protein [Salmonella enterica subsp. enterica serovar Agama]EAB7580565.1 DUF262 domain-containing protein [Salmonella enterica subsp. enterica]EAT8288373.1 DUF262 domain-containing protein [Salmonella enterica]EBQ9606455.1 DUF262 domain-containing protein [Salmonella enterica subsp. enterica serovar Virchow]ECN6294478.1 DUF262 domain-containing protein [Salmonella enterica subsp. enterica serovar Typhimurium]EDE7941133.1 DUF262 domain-containing protein [Salmonella e